MVLPAGPNMCHNGHELDKKSPFLSNWAQKGIKFANVVNPFNLGLHVSGEKSFGLVMHYLFLYQLQCKRLGQS